MHWVPGNIDKLSSSIFSLRLLGNFKQISTGLNLQFDKTNYLTMYSNIWVELLKEKWRSDAMGWIYKWGRRKLVVSLISQLLVWIIRRNFNGRLKESTNFLQPPLKGFPWRCLCLDFVWDFEFYWSCCLQICMKLKMRLIEPCSAL